MKQSSDYQSRYSRQSFLGEDASEIIRNARVAVVGLGGGGSHIVQQCAHLGFRNFDIFDPDVVEWTNLNRLVGATESDAEAALPKVAVAERLIRGLHAKAEVRRHEKRWQANAEALATADIVFGCVDGFAERRELEAAARRYLQPYIDIGLHVAVVAGHAPRIGGQIILSLPGEPCMQCLGFLNEATLAREAAKYGDAGVQPQVVWANGVLASTAVGIAVEILTGWSGTLSRPLYLSYDGNTGLIAPHIRTRFVTSKACPHYALEDVGPPRLRHL